MEVDGRRGFIGHGVQQREMRIELSRQIERGIEPAGESLVIGGVEQDRLH